MKRTTTFIPEVGANTGEMSKNEKAFQFTKLYFWIINILYPQNHMLQVKCGLKYFMSVILMSLSQSKKLARLALMPQSLPTDVINYYLSKCNDSSEVLRSVDINRIILIPAKIMKKCHLRHYQWISLTQQSTNGTFRKRNNFFCQIFTLEDAFVEKYSNCYYQNVVSQNEAIVFMTPTALHNLNLDDTFIPKIKRSPNTRFSVVIPLFNPVIRPPTSIKCGFGLILKKVKTVKLARLSSTTENVDNPPAAAPNIISSSWNGTNMDSIIRKYFEDTKFVRVGDVIPVSIESPLLGRRTSDKGDSVLYFQVTAIEAEEVEGNGKRSQTHGIEMDTNVCLYTASVSTTSLYLSENKIINVSHPVIDKIGISQRQCQSSSSSATLQVDIFPITAPPLENYINSLSEWLESFVELRSSLNVRADRDRSHRGHTSELWPTALITGIVGSGKYTICKAFAQKHGLNFYCVNMAQLIGDTSAFTIAKLTSVVHKAQALSSCILFIKNIHLLGKDKEGQEDKRVILSFTDFLRDINIKSYGNDNSHSCDRELPQQVFIIGSTQETEQIAPMLHDCFIHTSNIEPFKNGEEIVEALEWLLKIEVDYQLEVEHECNVEERESSFFKSSSSSLLFLAQNFDLAQWVENKNVKTVIKYWGDVKALLAIAIRKALTCAIETSSASNSDGRQNEDNAQNSLMDPLFMVTTVPSVFKSSCRKIILQEAHFTTALEALEVEIRSSVGSPKVPQVSWDDIGGLSNIKSELINSVQLPLKYPYLFTSGLKRSGILLYGPPGTGKTLVAKAVASEFKINFLSVKGPELLNMYVGQSEKNVREVFDRARDCAPCVLFFDELDSLAPNRGRSGDSGGVMDRVVSQILAEMDGTHSTPGVFIIGATNRPDLIDPALLRPGRFDKLLYVGICEEKDGIRSILAALTRKFKLNQDVDLDKLAEKLPIGMSGADIYSFCSESFMNAITKRIEELEKGESTDQDSAIQVSQDDFYRAMERISTSLSKTEVKKYEGLKTLMR